MKRFYYVTTPIYYVNAEPHIGHTYTTVVADTLARYHRLRGDETCFLTGTDEHGEKMLEAAAAPGPDAAQPSPTQVSGLFRDTWDELDIRYDRFIRTTGRRPRARRAGDPAAASTTRGEIDFARVRGALLRRLRALPDRARPARTASAATTSARPSRAAKSNYFFRMSRALRLARATTSRRNPDFIRPERYRNEVLGHAARRERPRRSVHLAARSRGSTGASSCPSTPTTSATSGSTR